MLEVVRELVDALHGLKAITPNRRAELHAKLDEIAATSGATGRALADGTLQPDGTITAPEQAPADATN